MDRMGVVHIDTKQVKWYSLISRLIEKYPYNSPYTGFMQYYRNSLDSYLWFVTLKDSILSTTFNQGKRKQIEIVKKFLSNSMYEYYYASRFGYSALNASVDSIKALYEDFKQEFPNSFYLKGVEKHREFFTEFFGGYYPKQTSTLIVEKQDVVSLNKVFIPEMSFIEQKDSITSLDSLLSKFKGKPVFIDIWASWCPPCRYEFQFANTLYDFLSKNGFDMLYLSVDKSEEKWLSVAKQYALKGFHFRVSKRKIKCRD